MPRESVMTAEKREALLLVLHGSPYAESNAPVEGIARQLSSDVRFARIITAYMECNQPSIAEAVRICAQDKIERIVAVPWFLHTGRHMVLDIPTQLAMAAKRHPQIQILLTDPVGMSSRIAEALAYRADEALKK